jgi:UDP-N-acetylmuramoyl-L-alanyl-D-glutamate--2,6-diaminopimelate ligase
VSARPITQPRSVTIGDLAATVNGARVLGDASTLVHGLTYDSRKVQPGDLFSALRGSDFDGHRYIDTAIANGAVAVLAEQPVSAAVPVIVSENSRAALASISAAFYGYPSRELTMIGLTGTDGKTTTSFLVRDILEAAGRQTGMIGTVGIGIGDGTSHHLPHQTTPESNLVHGYLREMIERGTTAAVLEATSHGLAMHRLDGVAFSVAGVTNITHEHLEYHKTIENYRRAKALLIERVADTGGVVVLNADDEGASSLEPFAEGARVLWYSVSDSSAEIHARNVVAGSNGCELDLVMEGQVHRMALPLLGDFNVANALCAIGVTRAVGVSLDTIVAALRNASGVPGRMNRVVAGQPFNVIVDYAHTPESLRKILTLLRRLHRGNRVIVVSGSAGERDPGKRPLQGAVCAELADVTIVTSEDPRNEDPEAINAEIVAGAYAQGAVMGESLFTITDRREAIRLAFSLATPGDCVVLAGKGHETSMIWGYEHRPWDEAQVAHEELAAAGWSRSGKESES